MRKKSQIKGGDMNKLVDGTGLEIKQTKRGQWYYLNKKNKDVNNVIMTHHGLSMPLTKQVEVLANNLENNLGTTQSLRILQNIVEHYKWRIGTKFEVKVDAT